MIIETNIDTWGVIQLCSSQFFKSTTFNFLVNEEEDQEEQDDVLVIVNDISGPWEFFVFDESGKIDCVGENVSFMIVIKFQ